MRHPIYPIDLHLDAEISSPRIRQEGTHTRRYWYLGLALRNLFPSIGTAVKAMDKKKKLYQVGGGGGSGSSAVTLGPRFPYASLVQPGPLRTTSTPLPLSIANRFSLSLLHFPPFPSSAHRHVVTRAVLLHGRFVRVKNDWFCLIRGQERGTWHRASANCEMQEFKEARPEVRSASTGSPM